MINGDRNRGITNEADARFLVFDLNGIQALLKHELIELLELLDFWVYDFFRWLIFLCHRFI